MTTINDMADYLWEQNKEVSKACFVAPPDELWLGIKRHKGGIGELDSLEVFVKYKDFPVTARYFADIYYRQSFYDCLKKALFEYLEIAKNSH